MASAEILIVDYGMGNVGSVMNMIKKVGGKSVLSDDVDVVARARNIIVPGVGHFDKGIRNLRQRGLYDALCAAKRDGARLLGICLGMQLMTKGSEESSLEGLGWFPVQTKKFPAKSTDGTPLRVPHMGWNVVKARSSSDDRATDAVEGKFYFVHSYYVDAVKNADCIGTTEYGGIKFASAVRSGDTMGVQFHPEKSHRFGIALFNSYFNGSRQC